MGHQNNEGTVSVLDAATDKVIKTIAVGVGPRHTFFSPDGLQAYVTNEFDDTLSVVDTASCPRFQPSRSV